MAAKRRSRGGSRTFRNPTDWLSAGLVGTVAADVTGSGSDTWDLSNTAPVEEGAAIAPETVRRIRGRWLTWGVVLPGGPAPGIREVCAAIGVESIDAIAAQATPKALTDSYWDGWMWRSTYMGATPVALLGNAFFFSNNDLIWEIDSKAQRKLDDGHLFLNIEILTDSGELDQFSYWFDLRWLQSITAS